MSVWDSFHSFLDYECLLFHCDWLGSDLRVGHFFSFRCPLVNTPQLALNHDCSLTDFSSTNDFSFTNGWLTYEWTGWRLQHELSTNESVNYVSCFYNSGRTDERTLPPTVRVLVCFIRCHGNVLTEPLLSNGLFRVYLLSCKRVLIP
jgi:hypothetical protein